METIRRSISLAIVMAALVVMPATTAVAQNPVPEPPTACPESDLAYAVSKCAAWVATDQADQAFASGTSPDGEITYALGSNYSTGRFETVAYDTATGAQLWRASRVGGLSTLGGNLAVAPDGGNVYVTGWSYEGAYPQKVITIAYDAVTGAEKWVRISQSQWTYSDVGNEVTVSPDSQTVYVGAEAYHSNQDGTDNRSDDYFVIALKASDGTQLWARTFDSVENQYGGGDRIEAMAVSPDGQHLAVTGRWGRTDGYAFGTFSLDTATGDPEWFDKYTGGAERFDEPYEVQFSPDSSRVFVVGDSFGGFGYQRATVAYDVATGARIWVARFVGTGAWADFGRALVVSPDGERVYVTGESVGSPVPRVVPTMPGVGLTADISTQALDADTGEQIWEARYSVPRGSSSHDIAVSPDGSEVYVAGMTWTFTAGWNIVTLAYETSLGLEQWVARYSSAPVGIGNQDDWDPYISIAPDGSRVFTVGTSRSSNMVTIGYETAGTL